MKKTRNIRNEKGVALITMLLFLVVLTVIGLTSISLTSLENRTAQNERSYEERINDQEAGVEPQVNVLERTIADGGLPVIYIMPSGPVPVLAAPTLEPELITNLIEADDTTLVGALGPDLQFPLGTTTVNMDIDYLFTKIKAGNAVEFAAASEGVGNSVSSGGSEKIYQMTSVSSVNTAAAISNSYTCVISGACQK